MTDIPIKALSLSSVHFPDSSIPIPLALKFFQFIENTGLLSLPDLYSLPPPPSSFLPVVHLCSSLCLSRNVPAYRKFSLTPPSWVGWEGPSSVFSWPLSHWYVSVNVCVGSSWKAVPDYLVECCFPNSVGPQKDSWDISFRWINKCIEIWRRDLDRCKLGVISM